MTKLETSQHNEKHGEGDTLLHILSIIKDFRQDLHVDQKRRYYVHSDRFGLVYNSLRTHAHTHTHIHRHTHTHTDTHTQTHRHTHTYLCCSERSRSLQTLAQCS